jgi:hypothetical protein
MESEEPRDILITNITREFGSAQHTRDMLKVEIFRIFKERGYSSKYGQVENIRIPFDGVFKKFYYAHLTMKNITTHTPLLEEIRRTRIIFGSEELVFSKAISYRPARRHLETARSSTSDQYGYSDPDYYELKQDEVKDKLDIRIGQTKTCSSVTGSSRLKRTREDDDIEWVDSKGEKEQENDELNFKNKMLKQEIEHSENKLANLRRRINQMETREAVISNEQWKDKEAELRDRENALILKEVELHVETDRKIRLNREIIEKERRQLKQKEDNIESRIRIEMYKHSMAVLQAKLNEEMNKVPKEQKE